MSWSPRQRDSPAELQSPQGCLASQDEVLGGYGVISEWLRYASQSVYKKVCNPF